MSLIILLALWVVWCAFHSLLIDLVITEKVHRLFPSIRPFYRLAYNCLACATLLPLILATHRTGGAMVYEWQGWWHLPRAIILLGSCLLFSGGARHYDLQRFLGITQLQDRQPSLLISDNSAFLPQGIFAVTRHPWYLGSMLAVWTVFTEYTLPMVCVAAILTGYLIIGTYLEERKILTLYGSAYGTYQKQVSMLFPCKWLLTMLKNKMR